MAVTRNADAVAPVASSAALTIWFSRHARTAVASLGRFVRQPFASLMIVLVIAVTLAIPAALSLIVKNATRISAGWDNALDFSVYLEMGLSETEADVVRRLVAQRADVAYVRLITATQALDEFRTHSGFADALDQLSGNPLPHTLVVRPSPLNTEQSILLLKEELANLPEVDIVQVDSEWVRRFHAILDIVQQAIMGGAVVLGMAIVVIIGNTIRLEIQNRREEIEVTKLIGGSNAFVRRPFLWSGFWYGLFGGLLALAFVQYGMYSLEAPVTRLAGLYQGGVTIVALGGEESLAIVGVAVALGLLGSWFTAARHMRRIEPR